MRLAILIAFAALASSAHAQTACTPNELDHAGCDPAVPRDAADPRFAPPYACNFAQRLTLGAEACQARKAAATHQRIGELIHAGRCDEAATAARATGDQDYAGRVQQSCAEIAHPLTQTR